MVQSSVFSSAHAIRLPLASMYIPLARPEGCMKVESTPSTLHSMMRLLFWSVKKTLPMASQVGPSVNEKSLESFSSFAPGAITLCAEAQTNEAANAPMTTVVLLSVFMIYELASRQKSLLHIFGRNHTG